MFNIKNMFKKTLGAAKYPGAMSDPQGPQYPDETLDDPTIMHQPAPVTDSVVDEPIPFSEPKVGLEQKLAEASTGTRMSGTPSGTPPFVNGNYTKNSSQPVDIEDMPATPRIKDLENRLKNVNDPYAGMSFKKKLLYTGIKALPMVLGGALGGEWGGSAAGFNDEMERERQDRQISGGRLLDQLKEARGQQERQYERKVQNQQFQDQMNKAAEHEKNLLEAISEKPEYRTATVQTPDGPKVLQWNPETKTYDRDLGKPFVKPPAAPKPGDKANYNVKMVEGQPVAYGVNEDKYWFGDEPDVPAEAVAALSPYQKAHKLHLSEEVEAEGRKAAAKGKVSANLADKIWEPALDASKRLAVMEDAYYNPDATKDQAMLMNHIAMTMAGKGMRVTEAEIRAHAAARSLPENLQVLWDKVANGQGLSQEQRERMYQLAVEMHKLEWAKAQSRADLSGAGGKAPKDIYEPRQAPVVNVQRGADGKLK